MRDNDTMELLREMELRLRESEFWRSKPKGAEAAIRRLYLTGAGDCGGSDWPLDELQEEIDARIAAEHAQERKFEAMWKRDAELARSVDWRHLSEP
ncbi:hypothetical protein [Mesorhizobium sp. B2-8-3]|uniref:hypothetical protein n=1 Tax=Mesorhizobium sp. B2-8-3 TaxID=2589905 RepID=UPI001129A0E0|nr:hypothetical protein [Mesorhizobium sp. B2-8-3]TPJ27150.1 hypothetical protein FJ418_28715 [Mesorhizobium sp. B2-8-3]